MTDDIYAYWRRAIEITGGKRSLTRAEQQELVVTEEAQAGFFKRRTSRAGALAPLAIWPQGEVLVAIQDGKAVAPEDVWTYACRWPITEAQYHARMSAGTWEDEDTAVSASLEPPPAVPGMGSNNPPEETPEQEIARKIEAASANAKDYVTITDEATAGRAQSVRSRLLELAGEADVLREREKKPFLEGGRVVDKKWKPVIDAGETAANAIRVSLSAFATAQRKAARAKAAEAAKAAAEAAKKGQPAPTPAPEPPVPVAPTQIGGAYGRRASVRTIRVVTAIDYDKAYTAMKNHPELKDLIAKLAQRAVDKGVEVDGVTYEEREDVR